MPAGAERAVTCRRTSEIDLPGFLDEPRRPEFAEFREHYPRCRDCAAEVRVWTELQAALRAGGAAAGHPEPEQLARYDGAPGGLAPAEHRALEAHLATCAACRDELRALRGWAEATHAVPARVAAPGRGGSWLAALRRLLWYPALAYVLLAAFVAPTLYRQLVGQPAVVEQAAEPTALAKAEKVRRVEEPPASAREQEAPTRTPARPYESAPAAAAEAPRAPLRERIPSAETPHASVPEPKASAESPRAATPPPPAVARLRPAPEAAAARRLAPELGAAREAPSAEADRETAPTRLGSAAPAPAAEVIAPELRAEEATAAGFADDALVELPVDRAAVLALRAGEIPSVSAASARAGLRLSVTDSEPGVVEIRVVAPGGGRELRERRTTEAGAVTIELPPEWLAPGRYEVSVRHLGADFVTDEAGFAFDVGREGEAELER